MRRRLSILAAVALIALTGCARGITVGSPAPTTTYSVSVQNVTSVDLIVSYNDGSGDALLGTVRTGATERFVIAGSAASSIRVSGVAVSGSRTSGPYTVSLIPGRTQTVILR